MTHYDVVPFETEHVDPIAINMRMADKREIWAQSLSRPHNSLEYCRASSVKSWCGLADGEPVVVFGVAPYSMMGGIGSPWLLGTDAIEKHAVKFLRDCRFYVSEMMQGFDILRNYVDARNTTSIQWLKWMGFDILDIEHHGAFNLPFHKFEMENKNV